MTETLAAAPRTFAPVPHHLTLVASVSLAEPAARPAVRVQLARREREMLALMADGYSTREVAAQMCYSERTIKNVLQELTTRFHLRNRTQAVAWALRNGLI